MTYRRVIPRDLFNEGDLLNCLGRLWIKLDDRRDHKAKLEQIRDDRFDIGQDPADGSIACHSVVLLVDGDIWPLYRPLNARSKWPLYALMRDDKEVRVFEENGDLSTAFLTAIAERAAA